MLDGHKSHITYEIRDIAKKNDIHLLKIPPHTTHLLQTLDVGVFNDVWQTVVADFTRRERRIISKKDFPGLLKKVWESYKPQWGISGLKKTGIILFNPECIQETNFRLSEPFHTSNEPSTSHQDLTLPLINQHHSSPPNLNTSSTSDDQLSYNHVPSNSQPSPICNHPSTHPYTTQLPNETSLINDLPSTLNQQPPSSIFIPSTPNSPQTSPVTDSVTDHLNSSSDIRLNAVEIVSSDGLRDFFAKLLESQTPTRQRKKGRKRLTGLGESLTSDEVMEIMMKKDD